MVDFDGGFLKEFWLLGCVICVIWWVGRVVDVVCYGSFRDVGDGGVECCEYWYIVECGKCDGSGVYDFGVGGWSWWGIVGYCKVV